MAKIVERGPIESCVCGRARRRRSARLDGIQVSRKPGAVHPWNLGCPPAQCLPTDTAPVAWNSSLLVGFVDGERADGYYLSAVLAIPRS